MDSLTKIGNKKQKRYDWRLEELNWKHFWLEVAEIAVGIIVAHIAIEGIWSWVKSLIK